MKIVDKMNESIKAGRPFFSFEFFPPRTEEVGLHQSTLIISCYCITLLQFEGFTRAFGWGVSLAHQPDRVQLSQHFSDRTLEKSSSTDS